MIDEFTRECLVRKFDRGVASDDVVDAPAELFVIRSLPKRIRSDNGLEFIALLGNPDPIRMKGHTRLTKPCEGFQSTHESKECEVYLQAG